MPVAPTSSVMNDLARALEILAPALDIANERVVGPAPPGFSEARGYSDFLASLGDEELARCEAEGLASRLPFLDGAPASLAELGRGVVEIASFAPALVTEGGTPLARRDAAATNVKERKRKQLEALLAAIQPMALGARRIVDVGAGSGHLSRLAAERFDRDVLGLDREPTRVDVAAALARGTRASFVVRDAFASKLALEPGDLAIGLHACGGLGDKLVVEASEAPADVTLVSCCLQKIEGDARLPLSSIARAAGFVLPREVLGLSNLTSRPVGVEASLADMLAAREARFALFRFLQTRGVSLSPGEEMRGINRRRAHRGLAEIARMACENRGLSAPMPAEIEEHERAAAVEFGRMRRFSLPRAMLSRALEVAVVLDRAAALAERGHEVFVRRVFDPEVTPRNLAIFAKARR